MTPRERQQLVEPGPHVPLYPEIGIVAFVPDTWGAGVWQVRHQVITRLARYFNVIWADPPLGWREACLRSPLWARFERPKIPDTFGLEIYRHSKLTSKFYRPRSIADLTRSARVNASVARLRRRGCTRIIGYLWQPRFFEELSAGDFDTVCYHIDDEYSFSPVEKPVDELELRIIREVDQVFIHSPAMMEKKGRINPRTQYMPNGVDYELYIEDHPVPDDLASIDGPIAMYIGVLKSETDWELLANLVDSLPEVSFVFIGPEGRLYDEDRERITRIREQVNAHFLGSKPADRLPAYANHADVCLMPYRINDYTKYIFPLKANEYLAAGKPAVGTPIRSLLEFSDVIELATTHDEWIVAIRQSLGDDASGQKAIAARREVASRYSWDAIVDRIASAMLTTAEADARD